MQASGESELITVDLFGFSFLNLRLAKPHEKCIYNICAMVILYYNYKSIFERKVQQRIKLQHVHSALYLFLKSDRYLYIYLLKIM